MANKESGGKMVNKTVPAAVLNSGTIPKISRPGSMTSAPDWPKAPPKTPATAPNPIVCKMAEDIYIFSQEYYLLLFDII
jgi:hypothetical protein